jgi:hypothetical protein
MTILYTGVLVNRNDILDTEENYTPKVQVTDYLMQIYNEHDELVMELTYEELRGILGIMAAEQEKDHLLIRAKIKEN